MSDARQEVASGILPDVEGGILPPGNRGAEITAGSFRAPGRLISLFPPGRMPGATAGRDARRYSNV
jgi:hypothetical protein